MEIFRNSLIHVLKEESAIPWVKVFSNTPYTELTDCDPATRSMLFATMEIIERWMLEYYRPKKINLASFGNYVPHVHIHVMARFEDDPFFPEPMWGKRQRNTTPTLPPEEPFFTELTLRLKRLA